MQSHLKSVMLHLLVFILIEILFVFLILREFPEISLFETIGIVHLSYWLLLIIAGIWRQSLHTYWQKFLASYIPVCRHIAGHIYVTLATVESIHQHHHEHDLLRTVIATLTLGVLILVGERLLHSKYHCDTCHASVHKHCPKD